MTTSQQFLDQLIEATASAYQALIQGISDFHRDRGWISEKQAIAVKTSAYKARMAVPSSLVIRESLPAVQSSQSQQSVYDDDEAGPFPNHDVTIVRSGVKMYGDVGDRLTISNGIVTGRSS